MDTNTGPFIFKNLGYPGPGLGCTSGLVCCSRVRRTTRKQESLQGTGSVRALFGAYSVGTGQNKPHIPFSQQTNFLRYTRSQMDFRTVGTRTRDSTLKVLESNPKFPQGPNQPVRLVGGGGLEMKQILESRPKQEKNL